MTEIAQPTPYLHVYFLGPNCDVTSEVFGFSPSIGLGDGTKNSWLRVKLTISNVKSALNN